MSPILASALNEWEGCGLRRQAFGAAICVLPHGLQSGGGCSLIIPIDQDSDTMRELARREDALRLLRKHGRERRFSPRQTIFARGDDGDSLAIVESGVVRISIFGHDGRELVLALLGPGDVIGELAVIDNQPRAADVMAVGDVTLTVVEAGQLRELLYSERCVTDFFLHLLCDRIRSANAHAETYALNSLAGRLAIYFVNHGKENGDGSLTLPDLPSQAELAKLVGVTRESVNRQFRAWRETGLLVADDDGYAIPDPVRLQESALTEQR
jgi:CRP/FNR family transcriptional regulator, cyclic AMP receptor protein